MDWKPAGAERSTPRVPAKRGSEPTWRGSEATVRRSEPTSRVSSRPGGEARRPSGEASRQVGCRADRAGKRGDRPEKRADKSGVEPTWRGSEATGRRSEPTGRVSSRPGVEASRQAGERGQGRFAGPGMPFPGALGTTRRDYGQVRAQIAARFILLHRKTAWPGENRLRRTEIAASNWKSGLSTAARAPDAGSGGRGGSDPLTDRQRQRGRLTLASNGGRGGSDPLTHQHLGAGALSPLQRRPDGTYLLADLARCGAVEDGAHQG